VNLKPLFPGSSEPDQLKRIFKVMGTPSVEKWPTVADLPEWKPENFEKYPGLPLSSICPKLEPEGLDLMEKLLKCNPMERITAKKAVEHPYFNDIPETLRQLYKK